MSDDSICALERSLIEEKKRAMEAEFGCHFGGGNSSIPPELEWDWLHYIEEFERQFRQNRETTVRRFVGNPAVRPLSELSDGQIAGELARLLDLLAGNSIIVHFTGPLSAGEMYRFVAEELLDEEMDDIRIPGMTHNFLYEDFHPLERRPERGS